MVGSAKEIEAPLLTVHPPTPVFWRWGEAGTVFKPTRFVHAGAGEEEGTAGKAGVARSVCRVLAGAIAVRCVLLGTKQGPEPGCRVPPNCRVPQRKSSSFCQLSQAEVLAKRDR